MVNNKDYWDAEQFYQRLEELLKERNLSMNSLMTMIEGSPSLLYELKRKDYIPKLKTICEICDALEINLHEFFEVKHDQTAEQRAVTSLTKKLSQEEIKIVISLLKIITEK